MGTLRFSLDWICQCDKSDKLSKMLMKQICILPKLCKRKRIYIVMLFIVSNDLACYRTFLPFCCQQLLLKLRCQSYKSINMNNFTFSIFFITYNQWIFKKLFSNSENQNLSPLTSKSFIM